MANNGIEIYLQPRSHLLNTGTATRGARKCRRESTPETKLTPSWSAAANSAKRSAPPRARKRTKRRNVPHLRRLLVGNRTDYMSPYVIFGPPHRCLLKNLFDPPKNLFQQHRSSTGIPRCPRHVTPLVYRVRC